MIDALLFSVRDGIRAAGFGYGEAQCELTDAGKPPARAGNIFVGVHEGPTRSTNDNCLMEYYTWILTLTMRVAVPKDRVGDTLLASKLARKTGPGQPSFNSRVEQLRAWGHMNWERTVLAGRTPPSANDNLVAWAPPGVATVYGFVEPARFRGASKPALVYGDWFASTPEAPDVGLMSELKFEGARRMQPQTAAVGPFV